MNTVLSLGYRRSARLRFLMVLLAMAVLPLQSARAAEAGVGNFPFGAQTSYAAFLPEPGTTSFYGYALYFASDSVRDAQGERVPADVEILALAPRVVRTWTPSWAGFKLSTGLVLQGLHVQVDAGGVRSEATGPGLFGVEPLYLTRSFGPHWHVLTGPLLYFPMGSYDRNEPANYTLNYKSYAYQGSVTWTPTPTWEASLNYGVEFKEKNRDTDYRSGDQGSLTFGFGHRPFSDPRWDVGLSGYYTHALSDDEQSGVKVGNRTRRLGIGPKVGYFIAPGTAVILQWHRETNVRNSPKGDLIWLECTFPL